MACMEERFISDVATAVSGVEICAVKYEKNQPIVFISLRQVEKGNVAGLSRAITKNIDNGVDLS